MTFMLSLTAQYEQRGFCGTDNMALIPGLIANKEAINEGLITFRDDVTYIPITWHLIGLNDGSSKVLLSKVIDQMCSLNEDYEVANFHFYIKSINNINNTNIYNDYSIAVNGVFNFQKDGNSINIFVPKTADDTPGDGSNTLGFYDPGRDWLVMGKGEVNGSSATLAHEIGHFFNLPHPHLGWDAESYDEAEHGNPAPNFSPGGIPTERQDGSNCETAGDMICDTPPDYNFGFGWSNCNYNAGTMDPNGDVVDPMEINFMGYFLNCPREEYTFTPMQVDIMLADYMNSGPDIIHNHPRTHLQSNYVPALAPITEQAVLTSPVGGETTPGANAVEFQWEDVPGATQYVVEIDRVSSFAVQPISMIAWGSYIYVDMPDYFEADKSYHWRVRPWSDGQFCGPAVTGTFRTGVGVATKDPDYVKAWKVFPNPIGTNAYLMVNIQSDQNFEAQINLYNITGQLVRSFGQRAIHLGDNNFDLNLDGFSNGVYTLTIQTEEGLLKERVVVSR